MQVFISDPIHQTILFGIVFCLACVFTFIPKKEYTSFSLTQELKGLAILTIIFAHIGYYLTTSTRFLFPFSIFAGVGVNLFLLLSGYGITMSQMKRNEGIVGFYKRRLLKLFVPFWLMLGILFGFDYLFLGKEYSLLYIFKALFGIFTTADLFTDLNSPLWYFTLILIYYLLFPIFFTKKRPWATALLLYFVIWALVYKNFHSLIGIISLYQIHALAFPLGIMGAWLTTTHKAFIQRCTDLYETYRPYSYPLAIGLLLVIIGYLAIYSNVGGTPSTEQATSVLTILALTLLFILKKRESKLFSLFGLYSYEIYLFHWPLLYRYDFVYKFLPVWTATILYLGLFIVLAMGLRKLSMYANKILGTE